MLYNKRCFFKEIFAFVFVVHLILLGVLFVCDTGKFHQERFVVNTNNLQSTVVFMPLKKRMQEQTIQFTHHYCTLLAESVEIPAIDFRNTYLHVQQGDP